ncbi:MAG TPA: response regulator [Bacteroidia bacterium]|jgi:CheY-like chemotaxis protein|nr:response regulator [Bacteroidia bacterium]
MNQEISSSGTFGAKFMNPSFSVLLVDDNRVNQFLGKRILQNLGIKNIELAGNGEDAFYMVQQRDFDVLLTDVEMPGMDGYELSMAIRHSEKIKNKKLIIIALTANASEEDRDKAKAAGIDDYLTKPYSPQDLLEILQNNLSHRDDFLLEDIQPTERSEFHPGIEKIYAIFRDNKEDVKHFLYMLSNQLPTLHEQIKTGLENQNWEQVFQASHKIKSPIKMLASDQLIEHLTIFTEDLKSRINLDAANARFDAIAPELEAIQVLVNRELENLV